MKVICFADLHIGQKAYCKIEPESGLHQREIRAIKILNKIVNDAIKNQIDVVIFAGDMFKNNLPNPTLINKVNEAFLKLSNNKIYTLILDGNHDVSKLKAFSSGLHQFQSLQIPYITQTRFYQEELITINDETYRFIFLPTHHSKDEIENLVSNIDDKYKTIIIGHLTIKNANLNDWNVIDNDDCIDKEIFKKKNILAVILGHLHKHQILNYDPFIFYCGSADRIDFSEEKQDKGYVYLEISDKIDDVKFVSLKNTQKFLTISLDCQDESNAETIENLIIDKLSKRDLKNCIIRIKLKLSNEIKLNEKKIITYAYEEKQAQYLLKIQYEFNNQINNNIVLSNALPTLEAVATYYEGQTRADERIKICKDIIERVDCNVS